MHELEMVDGQASMAYTGKAPWHGLGYKVDPNLTPAQMLKAAKLNWTVSKVRAFANIDGEETYIGHDALVRNPGGAILDVVTEDWNTVQNAEAFEFFNEFCDEGKMSMETAGSLRGGQLVWGLAKLQEAFDLFKGKDKVDGYMLFVNPHLYGWSTSVSLTAVRVVCMNTLRLSLAAGKGKSDKIVKVSHRREFVAEQVKEALGVSKLKLGKYKEMATFLASKKAPKTDIVEYFKRIFPVLTTKDDSKKVLSKAAGICLDVMDTQPGAELGAGTWWQGYNTVTFYTDHLAGRSANNRLNSAWFGVNKSLKIKALETAIEMANAS